MSVAGPAAYHPEKTERLREYEKYIPVEIYKLSFLRFGIGVANALVSMQRCNNLKHIITYLPEFYKHNHESIKPIPEFLVSYHYAFQLLPVHGTSGWLRHHRNNYTG
jgi:hypothetical protein